MKLNRLLILILMIFCQNLLNSHHLIFNVLGNRKFISEENIESVIVPKLLDIMGYFKSPEYKIIYGNDLQKCLNNFFKLLYSNDSLSERNLDINFDILTSKRLQLFLSLSFLLYNALDNNDLDLLIFLLTGLDNICQNTLISYQETLENIEQVLEEAKLKDSH